MVTILSRIRQRSTLRITESTPIHKFKIKWWFQNKFQIKILMELCINRPIARWPPIMKCILTTNTSWSKTKVSLIIDNPQVMPRSRLAVALSNLTVLFNMLLERTQIFKLRWLNQVTITLVISANAPMDIKEEDQRMLTIEKEKLPSNIIKTKTWWRWASWVSTINNLLHSKRSK